MKPHIDQDSVIGWAEHARLESEVNAFTILFARILWVGAKWKHWPRVKSAIIAHFSPIPLLTRYPKTHKDLSHLTPETQTKGPPSRPVCGASEILLRSEAQSEEITLSSPILSHFSVQTIIKCIELIYVIWFSLSSVLFIVVFNLFQSGKYHVS